MIGEHSTRNPVAVRAAWPTALQEPVLLGYDDLVLVVALDRRADVSGTAVATWAVIPYDVTRVTVDLLLRTPRGDDVGLQMVSMYQPGTRGLIATYRAHLGAMPYRSGRGNSRFGGVFAGAALYRAQRAEVDGYTVTSSAP